MMQFYRVLILIEVASICCKKTIFENRIEYIEDFYLI